MDLKGLSKAKRNRKSGKDWYLIIWRFINTCMSKHTIKR